jgi:hypothetical protein
MNGYTAQALGKAHVEYARATSGRDVKVIVYIDDALGEHGRQDLKAVVEGVPGVRSATFPMNGQDLLVVSYDRHLASSVGIVDRVRHQSVKARRTGCM